MASLRRKPVPDVAITAPAADPDPVAVSIDTDPVSPEPVALDLRENAGPATVPASALREQLEALRQSETMARQASLAAAQEQRRQTWLASNELAQQHYAALGDIHRDALNSGYVDTSPAYFDFMNNQLATLQARHSAPTHLVEEMKSRVPPEPPEPQPPSRGNFVSAPVSREPSGYGQSASRITLTREQADLARLAGITEAEYARQLLRLREMQASGEYSERR